MPKLKRWLSARLRKDTLRATLKTSVALGVTISAGARVGTDTG